MKQEQIESLKELSLFKGQRSVCDSGYGRTFVGANRSLYPVICSYGVGVVAAMYLGALEGNLHCQQLIHIQYAVCYIQTVHRFKGKPMTYWNCYLSIHARVYFYHAAKKTSKLNLINQTGFQISIMLFRINQIQFLNKDWNSLTSNIGKHAIRKEVSFMLHWAAFDFIEENN